MLAGKIGYFRATGFDPRSISGLAIWLDATDASTLFQDSAATVPATTGQPVGAWRSRASAGGSFTQTTNALRPTYTAAFQNSRPAVVSDGSTTWLSASSSSVGIGSLGAGTAFFVYRRTGGGNAAWDFGTNASTNINVGNTSLFDDTFRTARTPGAFVGVNVGITTVSAPTGNAARGYRVNGAQMPFTDSQFFNVPATVYVGGGPAFPSGFASFGGGVCESLVYDRALSAAEISTVERYLSDKWGITLAPTASNADAQSWINRVYANGGTVSTTTANAVNQFCVDIENAGIRDRFYRLNLFCGTGLAAALVPLYRGQSLGGTQWGNSTDTNFNIVSGDYAETGTGGGLNGGSTKYLATGLAPNAAGISAFNTHLAIYSRSQITTNASAVAGFGGGGPQSTWQMLPFGGLSLMFYRSGGASNCGLESVTWSGANRSGHIMAVRSASNAAKLYRNGTDLAVTANTTNQNVWTATDVAPLFVFGRNNAGTADQLGFTGKLQSYSAGLSMTDAQASAYFTAMQAFQTALGRQL